MVKKKVLLEAGVIAYRNEGKKTEVLLIKNSSNKNWIIPKGVVEKGESVFETAEKESYEEAGIYGKLKKKQLGKVYKEKDDVILEILVYPFEVKEVLKKYPETYRKRGWFSPEEAQEKVENKDLKKILKKFSKDYGKG